MAYFFWESILYNSIISNFENTVFRAELVKRIDEKRNIFSK